MNETNKKKNFDTIKKHEVMWVGEREDKLLKNPCLAPGAPQKLISCIKNEWMTITADHYSKVKPLLKNNPNWKFQIREVEPPDKEVENLHKRIEKIETETTPGVEVQKDTKEHIEVQPLGEGDTSKVSQPVKSAKKKTGRKPGRKSKKKPSPWVDGKTKGEKEKPATFGKKRSKIQDQAL